jgi:hypothetical protein
MEVPPPFVHQMPAPKKSPAVLILSIIIGLIVLCCAGIGGFAYWGWRKVMPMAGCMINFQEVQVAVLDYAHGHHGKLPDADKWQDEVSSYYSTEEEKAKLNKQKVFQPLDPNGEWGCIDGDPKTGMAFNADLSGKDLDSIKDPESTPLIFEIPNPTRNANQPYKYSSTNTPKMFGSPRPWMVWYVERDMNNMGFHGNGSNFQIRSTTTTSGGGISDDPDNTGASKPSDNSEKASPSKPKSDKKAPGSDKGSDGSDGSDSVD